MVLTPERELVVRPRAGRQVTKAYDWYERQRPGLGDAFLLAVDDTFAAIRRGPLLYAEVRGRTRRVMLRGFPYGVFFYERPAANEVVVLGVIHGHRSPRRWPTESLSGR